MALNCKNVWYRLPAYCCRCAPTERQTKICKKISKNKILFIYGTISKTYALRKTVVIAETDDLKPELLRK